MADQEWINRLSKLDSCAVSDAADALGIAAVGVGIRAMWRCGKICGSVATVQLGTAGNRMSKRHLCAGAIEEAAPGQVIVVDHNGRTDAAGWGGILSAASKLKGLGGVIVHGACRDIDESETWEFPVFAKAAVPFTARGRVVEYGFNEPVDLDGVLVAPGDYVLADGSGVVFVPRDRAEELISRAEQISWREKEMIQSLEKGRSVSQVMNETYENMLKKG